MSDFIILFCTIFGTLIAYLAYKGSTSDVIKESKTLLLEKFEFLKTLNANLINDLYAYGSRNNSMDTIFMQGLTLAQSISILERVRNEILTQENFKAIKKTSSKIRIDEITKHLDTQIKHHSEIRSVFDLFIKPIEL